MKNKIKSILNKIKEHFNKLFDITVLMAENKILKQQLEEEKKKNQPLIDLKNKLQAELRVAKMQLGKYKKKEGRNEETINNNDDFFNNWLC